MNTLKLFFFSVIVSVGIFSSCTNTDTIIENLPDPQESEAMQTTVDLLKTMYTDDGTVIDGSHPTGNLIFDFCFEFVYPINLIYNTGTTVTVNSNEELIEVLINTTNDLYIIGVEFPFDVLVFNPDTDVIETITITNESEFAALFINCNFGDPCDCENEYEPVCVEVEENGTIIIITFPNECYAECEGFTEDQYFECDDDDGCDCDDEYEPVCVQTGDGIIEFINACYAECEGFTEEDFVDCENDGCDCDDEYEPVCVQTGDGIIEFQNECYAECEGFTEEDFVDCENDGCDCDDEYEPVCVQTGEGIFEFINACWAECEGFTENDFVDCDDDDECEISDLEVEFGDCNENGTYPITINFEYEHPGNEYFDVYTRNDEFIGYYLLSDLPITIEEFELSGYRYDYIRVCINDAPDCCEETEWEAPDCD